MSNEAKDDKKLREQAIGSAFQEQALHGLSDLELMRRLWGFMAPYKGTFALSVLLLPVISGLGLVQPYILQLVIDDHLAARDFDGLSLLITAFFGSIVGRGIVQYIQFYVMQRAGQRALLDLRQRVFSHVQSLSVSFFHKNPVGRLMARMTTDVESLQEALSSGMVTMVGDLFTLCAIVVILLVKNWQLALVAFTVVPPLVLLTALFRYFMRKAYRQIRVKIARLYAHLQESIIGMEVIQTFVREHVSAAEYEAIAEDYRAANIKSIRYDAMLYAVVEAVGSITVGAIIWYGSGQVLDGVVTIGVLVAFIEYMQKFFVPIRDLAQKYNTLQSAMASSERIFELLDTQERLEHEAPDAALPEGPLRIEFEDVWFRYNPDEWILKGVSFTIEPGDKVALVGHTGAGKSTIMSLLLRLHDVTEGRVLVNGVDIRDVPLTVWRDVFSVVLQDAFLFRGSIRQNISLGDPTLGLEDVQAAAKSVRAHELIERYDAGYDHEVRERGANLSSGERQLISFARALAHHPQVLLLDEATANVDTETEALLQQALDVLIAQQTSLMIAHRLSTIRQADRILVLHRGELLERGTHDELLAHDGHYAKLHRLQHSPSTRHMEEPAAQ
ncbi:MAG: ABC transporter ATP-binding protein [Myxococcota bacterium]